MANAHPTRGTGKPSLALQLARYTAHLRSLPLGEAIAARVTFAALEAGVIEPGIQPEPAPDAARTFRDTTLRLSSLVQAQTADPAVRRAVEEAFAEAGRFVLGKFTIATGAAAPSLTLPPGPSDRARAERAKRARAGFKAIDGGKRG